MSSKISEAEVRHVSHLSRLNPTDEEVQLFSEQDAAVLEAYFVYPEELKSVARVQAFRDFLVSKAQRWNY